MPSVSVGEMNDLKWNGKETISFLNIFQNYPCLWDVQSDNYLNRNVEEESYRKLLEDLRIAEIPGTPELIKNKIKILRDTYRKKLDEFHKSNDGADDEVHKPKLIWFSAAEVFIHGSDTDRESSSNSDLQQCSTPEDEEDTANEESDSEHSTAESQKEKLESQSLVESLRSASTTTSTPTRKRPPLKMLPTQPEKFLKQQPQDKQLPSMFEKTVNKLQQITEQSAANTEDQYDTFSKHIASQLRDLPIRSFNFLQSKIQNLITEERIAYLNSSTIPPQSQGVDIQNSTTFQDLESTISTYCEYENIPSGTYDTSSYIEEGDINGYS